MRTYFHLWLPALVTFASACGDDANGDNPTDAAADTADGTTDVGTIGDTTPSDVGDIGEDADATPGDVETDAVDARADSADTGDIDTGVIPDSGDTSDSGDTADSADADGDTDVEPPPTVFTFVPDEGPTLLDPDFVTADGLILNRLDVTLSIDATAEQLDAALEAVGGTIAASRPGMAWLTVTIPAVDDLAGAVAVATTLNEQPGIVLATPSWTPTVHDGAGPLPVSTPGTAANRNLARMRFFPAWNAQSLAVNRVPVYVIDGFTQNETVPQLAHMRFVGPPAPGIQLPDEGGSFDGNHGFWVASILGALADDVPPVGTHPDPATSMDLIALQTLSAGSVTDTLLIMDRELPRSAFFVANASFGVSENVERIKVLDMAMQWRAMVLRRSPSFVLVASTGNEGYIFEEARFLSPFVLQARTDDPRPFIEGTLEGLLATRIWNNAIDAYGENMAARQGATLTVGAAEPGGGEADYSNRGGMITMIASDVSGVCERIGGRCDSDRIMTADGTSAAAPLAAGLAAWIAAIDPSMTAEEIVAHLRSFYDDEDGYVDAYRATLALQERGIPIGRAIADVVTDGNIDENDISVVYGAIADSMAAASDYLLVDQTWDRTDLNGDGYSRADSRTSFDLDGDGSFSFVEVETPDGDGGFGIRRLDEGSVSDIEFLCWMGYGPWFSGSTSARDDLLLSHCGVRPDPLAVFGGRAIELTVGGSARYRLETGGPTEVVIAFQDALEDVFSNTDFIPDLHVPFQELLGGTGDYTIPTDSGSMSSSAESIRDLYTFDPDGNLTGGTIRAETDCVISFENDFTDACAFNPDAPCEEASVLGGFEHSAGFTTWVPHRLVITGSVTTSGYGEYFSTSKSYATVYISLNDNRTTWEHYGGDGELQTEENLIVFDEIIPPGNHYLYTYVSSSCGNGDLFVSNPNSWPGSLDVTFTLTPILEP